MSLSYQKITLYGDDLTDYVMVNNIIDSQTTINSTLAYNYVPTWGQNTMMLAPFTSDINGGQGNNDIGDVINWWVYKKRPTDLIYKLVAVIPVAQTTLVDYNVLNNSEYQYIIFGETSEYLTAPITSNLVSTSWWDWSLVGMLPSDTADLYYADSNNIWLFDTNLTSDPMVQNLAIYVVDNFTQYPKISQGQKNYISGGIDCLISNYDMKTNTYTDTVTMQETFKAFINNGNLKLLRDRKGNGYVVQTTANEVSYIDNSDEQITKVKISYTQVGDCLNYRVVGA